MPDALVDLERRVLRLRPASDEQKWFRDQALQLVGGLEQIQRLLSSQERTGSCQFRC